MKESLNGECDPWNWNIAERCYRAELLPSLMIFGWVHTRGIYAFILTVDSREMTGNEGGGGVGVLSLFGSLWVYLRFLLQTETDGLWVGSPSDRVSLFFKLIHVHWIRVQDLHGSVWDQVWSILNHWWGCWPNFSQTEPSILCGSGINNDSMIHDIGHQTCSAPLWANTSTTCSRMHCCVVLWVYRAGGAGEVFLQEQQSIDPPSMARQEAAQPRYRPVPSSYLQHHHTQR